MRGEAELGKSGDVPGTRDRRVWTRSSEDFESAWSVCYVKGGEAIRRQRGFRRGSGDAGDLTYFRRR